MKVLFIGGTGNISSACTRRALAEGASVYHLNRGTHGTPPEGVVQLTADARDPAAVKAVLGKEQFDVVVDWITFTPEHVKQDIDMFSGRTGQFVFISSASAYEKPLPQAVVTESTPVFNPFWDYSQKKADCEKVLRTAYEADGFPATIVRPSHTYSDGWFPSIFGASDFTVPQRILDGKELVVHGDGTSLWTLTHADDFAVGFYGLLGNPRAVGEAFHITGDELLTWNQIYTIYGHLVGSEPHLVHMTSQFIAEHDAETGAGLLGDKAYSAIFDNTKIKRFVPGFHATISFHEGIRRSLAYLEAHPGEKRVDEETNALIDRLLSAWKKAHG